MPAASQGAQSKMCIEPGSASHTFDTSSEPLEFLSETLQKKGVILDTNGIRGTRSHRVESTKAGSYEVGGSIRFHPSPLNLDLWLPRILGAAESTDSFALAETLPNFGVMIDRVGGVFEYEDCVVNKATFRAGQNGMLELELDVWAVDETTGGTYPSLTYGVAAGDYPYVFHEGVLTLQSGERQMMDLEIVIDNMLERRFANSQTATSLTPKDRLVTVKTTNPFTSAEMSALYEQSHAGASGTVVFTNGNMSTTFTFGTLQVPDLSPVVSGKQEIPLKLEMTARMTGSTRELVVTHDGDNAS